MTDFEKQVIELLTDIKNCLERQETKELWNNSGVSEEDTDALINRILSEDGMNEILDSDIWNSDIIK